MPENTVYVGRPTKWGNPFRVKDFNSPFYTSENAVNDYHEMICADTAESIALREQARDELRGKNLACWCGELTPCHADVLLAIAND